MGTEATESSEGFESNSDAGSNGSDDEQHKIVIALTDDAYRKLKGTADRRHSSVAALVKDGLALAEWLEDESSRGAQVLVRRGDRLREVTLPGVEDGD